MFITTILTIAKTWKKTRCLLTDEWIKTMWYIYIYSAILLSHKKDQSNVICSDMDAARDYYTK